MAPSIEKDKGELKILQALIERRMKDLDWKISGERNEMSFKYNDLDNQVVGHIDNLLATANDNAVENYRHAVSNDHNKLNQNVRDQTDRLLEIAVSGLSEFPPVVKPTFTEHNSLKAKLARTLTDIRQQLVKQHGLSGKVSNPQIALSDGELSENLQAACDKTVDLLSQLIRNNNCHSRAALAKAAEIRHRVDLAAAELKHLAQTQCSVPSPQVATEAVINLFDKDVSEVTATGEKLQNNTGVRDEVNKVKVDVAYVLSQLQLIRKKY